MHRPYDELINLSLRHKSKIEQIETALAAFGKRLVVDVM